MPGTVLKLTVAYDGTHFAGWQRQKNARTVQQTLEEALRKIAGRKVQVTGAGRTDSGVHAQGQVAHVSVRTRLSPQTIRKALNATLPEDILIRSVQPAPSKFHARFGAKRKWYRYAIWNSPQRPLFNRNFVLHLPIPLNVAAMRKAARALRGRHDFKRFCSSENPNSGTVPRGDSPLSCSVRSTVRTLRRLTVSKKGHLLLIDAEADGFLYHMARRIAGLLIDIGRGKYPPSIAKNLLHPFTDSPFHRFKPPTSKLLVPPTAPAKGLCLMQVRYRQGHLRERSDAQYTCAIVEGDGVMKIC